jgi:hypothetical protein
MSSASALVWLYAPDLMDRSRVIAAHPETRVVADPHALLDAPPGATVLVDLGRDGVLEVVASLEARHTVGFANHEDDELMRSARAAGCDEVLTRRVFFRRWGSAATS